jgi:hypothetical protein
VKLLLWCENVSKEINHVLNGIVGAVAWILGVMRTREKITCVSQYSMFVVENSMHRHLHSYVQRMRENVGITITKILRSLDLFDNIEKLVFVTDRQAGGQTL